MTTYTSYAECKIAHPDSEVVTTGENWIYDKELTGTFQPRVTDGCSHAINDYSWVICNPADYCSSLKEFSDAGFKLVHGDIVICEDGSVFSVGWGPGPNMPDDNDVNRYILSASALHRGCKIPSKAEQWTIYNNTLSLCQLTDEQAAMLFNAWRKNNEILEFFVENWSNVKPKQISINGIYRIKPKSERELFIDAAVSTFDGRTSLSAQAMSLAAQLMFDSEKFKRVIKDGE